MRSLAFGLFLLALGLGLEGCPCGAGFKKCGNDCIPVQNCCTNADCPLANGFATCTPSSGNCAPPFVCNPGFVFCRDSCILSGRQCCVDADCSPLDNAVVRCAPDFTCGTTCKDGFQPCAGACITAAACCGIVD